MNASLRLATRVFPSRIADLGFKADLPADWISHDLPEEQPDFTNPTTQLPLAIVTAPHSAMIFAFAARPAYEDGTLHQWAWYLLEHNQLKPHAVGPQNIGTLPAVVGEATQESELGTMVVRFAFLEDGDRFINISLTAPELLADSVRDAWFALLNSFTLTTPRGSRFNLHAETTQPPTSTPVETTPEPEPAPAKEEKTQARKTKIRFATFALADNDASLNPEDSINANLRNRGIGLTPNVIATDDMEKFAIVGAGSILAQFRVPFGWHVIDDGKRVLIFEPKGEIQIHLHLMAREGRDNQGILNDLEAEARASYPNPEFMRMKEGIIELLGVRGIADGNQPLEQYHMLYPTKRKHVVLRARVTTVPPRSTDALNLAELILKSMDWGAFPQPEENDSQTEKQRRKAMVRDLRSNGPVDTER